VAPRALIVGLAGEHLGADERAFLAAADPWGAILFARNIREPAQVAGLVAETRGALGRADAPVLVDQEGGRVQRLGPPHWPRFPAAATIGALFDAAPEAGREAAWLTGRLIAADLAALGITVACLPVLDVAFPATHGVIGDRAYGAEPGKVATLGGAAAAGLMAGGCLPVMKHLPGHGRAAADSHVELPVVMAAHEELARSDFAPFRALRELPLAMTAHIRYPVLDPGEPATLSPRIISKVIREEIGFDGLLMSDDLSMGALTGTLAARGSAAIAAGCDVALHCNGAPAEMRELAAAVPELGGAALARAEAALARRHGPEPFDRAAGLARLAALLATA